MLLHPNAGSMQTDAVAALGNMALRIPENCVAIAAAGGIPAIANALAQHINLPRMQSKVPSPIHSPSPGARAAPPLGPPAHSPSPGARAASPCATSWGETKSFASRCSTRAQRRPSGK